MEPAMEGIRVELPAWAGGKKKKKPTMAESARGRIDRARAVVGNNDAVQGMAQATGMAKNESMCPKLTFQQRLYGVAGCFCTGLVLSFVGFLMWHGGRVDLFAVYYTFGNIVSICGSMFLFTPQRQIKSMFMAKRIWATGIYLTMLLATLIAAFAGAPAILLLLFIFVQWCALVWYFASYIPYGQKMITKAFSSVTNFA